jgi:predicted tellurium resistance membrane protein TerC
MLELLSDPQTWVSFLTLTVMEIVLGIDNVVFISILVGRLPKDQQDRGRKTGLSLALIFRLMLLVGISWIAGLVHPLFTLNKFAVSGRDLIMMCGGLFLLGKSTREIHDKLEGDEDAQNANGAGVKFWSIIAQIIVLDIVFSLDSVITAVGLVQHLPIMIAAVIASLGVMLLFAKAISDFVHRHPTVKMLALSFLLMIGLLLLVEGFHVHVPKGYVYFAMTFSLFVELLNLRVRKKNKPVKLREAKF